jgi:hypothetical protein
LRRAKTRSNPHQPARALLAVDKAVTVEPIGEFALKGIRRPMMTYNVIGSEAEADNATKPEG